MSCTSYKMIEADLRTPSAACNAMIVSAIVDNDNNNHKFDVAIRLLCMLRLSVLRIKRSLITLPSDRLNTPMFRKENTFTLFTAINFH